MKKIISLMLVLVMCLGVLTACNPIESIKGLFGGKEEYDLDAAKTYLKQIYVDYLKDNETDTAFSLVTGLDMSGVKYSINWTVDNEAITLTPSEDGTKVTVSFKKESEPIEYALTATITAPDGTSIEYVLNLIVPESNVISLATALAAEDGTKVTVRGTVVDIGTAWDDGYKNISVTIQDEAGNKLYLYRLKTKVELGDIIVATGEMATYNNARQMAAGGTAEIEGKDPNFTNTEAKEYTIPEALQLEDLTLVIVKGTVTKINTPWDDSYGNLSVTISDANGNTLYVYRLKTQVTLGDIITVTGKIGSYNDAKQIAAGATAEITGHDDTIVDTDDNNGGDNTGDNTTTTSTWTVVTDLTALKTGDKILIGNPSNGKLFSTQKTGYYNVGIDYSAEDFGNVTDDEIFVITVNEDGSYEFTSVSGNIIALAASYSSFNEEGTNKTWTIEAKEGSEGIYYIKNVGRGNYIEWYADKSNWSSYATSSLSNLFELSLYVWGSGSTNTDADTDKDTEEKELPTSAKFDFSTLTGTGDALTNDTALTLFKGLNDNSCLSAVSVTKIYNGTGLGGSKPSTAGLLKTGTSGAGGEGKLVLTFDGVKAVKVEIKCHDFYNSSEKYPTTTTSISVNGSDKQLAPYTEDVTFDTLTFTFDASETVTIDVASRIYIAEIVVYFE